jgi:hypothetical protein
MTRARGPYLRSVELARHRLLSRPCAFLLPLSSEAGRLSALSQVGGDLLRIFPLRRSFLALVAATAEEGHRPPREQQK